MKRYKPVIDNSGFTEPKPLMVASSTGSWFDADEVELVLDLSHKVTDKQEDHIKELEDMLNQVLDDDNTDMREELYKNAKSLIRNDLLNKEE